MGPFQGMSDRARAADAEKGKVGFSQKQLEVWIKRKYILKIIYIYIYETHLH